MAKTVLAKEYEGLGGSMSMVDYIKINSRI
jgi:hypothetical protein